LTFITHSLFGWLVADGWCWFVLREEYCWLVAGGWFVLREKYCWLVADKPSEQAANRAGRRRPVHYRLSNVGTRYFTILTTISSDAIGFFASFFAALYILKNHKK
jgi:hypothetical protein